jgi:tetratricopeptide (TPR) repeat protein
MANAEKTIKTLIYGLAALVPVFFLPISYNTASMDNFNKIILLQLGLALIFCLFAFSNKKFFQEKISFSFLDIALLLWLALNFLSAIYGNSFYTSFWGAFGSLTAPLAALICLAFWYFIIKGSRFFESVFFIKIIVYTAAIALFVLSVLFTLTGFGVIKPDNFLFDLARFSVGTTEQLSIYLALIAVLASGILLAAGALTKKLWQKTAVLFALFSSLAFLLAFNFFPAWLCLCVGLTVLLIGYLFHNFKEKSFIFSQAFILFIMVFTVSGFFLVFHLLNPKYYPSEQRLAPRLQLDWSATRDAALGSLSRQPLLGYGAEMFAPANSLIRQAKENAKPYWYVRFNQGSSFFFEQLIYSGLIGFSALAILLLIIFYFIIRLLFFGQAGGSRGDFPDYALSAVMAALGTAVIAYSADLAILFLFFSFLALLSRRCRILFPAQFVVVKGLKNTPRAPALIFAVLGGALIIFLMFNIKNLTAAAYYDSAGDKASTWQTDKLKTAIGLNPRVYQYHLKLAKYYHTQALNALAQADNQDDQITQDYINNSITAAKDALKAAPFAVAPYENLGKIYRDLGAYSPDANSLAVEFFKKAIEKEPSNPVLWTEIGIIYLKQGQAADAINALSRAKELKEKYYLAEYNLAKALVTAGQNAPALEILDGLAVEYPNIDIIYEQGKAYFNLKQYDKAIWKFSQVVAIEPLHANSLYSLGLSYSALGEVDEAMYYLNKVADLNPDNFKLIEQISELEKNK